MNQEDGWPADGAATELSFFSSTLGRKVTLVNMSGDYVCASIGGSNWLNLRYESVEIAGVDAGHRLLKGQSNLEVRLREPDTFVVVSAEVGRAINDHPVDEHWQGAVWLNEDDGLQFCQSDPGFISPGVTVRRPTKKERAKLNSGDFANSAA